jgi:hypothetical protein
MIMYYYAIGSMKGDIRPKNIAEVGNFVLPKNEGNTFNTLILQTYWTTSRFLPVYGTAIAISGQVGHDVGRMIQMSSGMVE